MKISTKTRLKEWLDKDGNSYTLLALYFGYPTSSPVQRWLDKNRRIPRRMDKAVRIFLERDEIENISERIRGQLYL